MKEPAAGKIRVLLIDALGLFRASLAHLLSSEGFQVAGECGTSVEALAILNDPAVPRIDIILLEFDLGTEHAADFIPAARNVGYQGHFFIVAGATDVRSSAMALRLGASGIFLKSEPPDRLVQAIQLVMKGDVWIDRKIIQLLADQVIAMWPRSEFRISGERLPDRAQRVLLGIIGGLTNRKIAANLGISESSGKNVMQHLFAVAGVRSRSQLVRVALEGSLGAIQGLMKPDAHENAGAPPKVPGRRADPKRPPIKGDSDNVPWPPARVDSVNEHLLL